MGDFNLKSLLEINQLKLCKKNYHKKMFINIKVKDNIHKYNCMLF